MNKTLACRNSDIYFLREYKACYNKAKRNTQYQIFGYFAG